MKEVYIPKKGEKIVGSIALSEIDIAYLQSLADDNTIETAAEANFMTRRMGEYLVERLRHSLNIKTRHGLIVHLVRTKVLK